MDFRLYKQRLIITCEYNSSMYAASSELLIYIHNKLISDLLIATFAKNAFPLLFFGICNLKDYKRMGIKPTKNFIMCYNAS